MQCVQDYARVNGYEFVLGIKQVDPQLENMWNKPGIPVTPRPSQQTEYASGIYAYERQC